MNWDVGIKDFFPPPCVWENTNQEETDRDWEQVTNDLMEEDALAQNTVSLLFIYKDSELATVDCYKLQVSSVMMIIIMRSKYFLRPIGTSSFSRIAVVGFSVLSGCESIRRQNFENINLPSRTQVKGLDRGGY